LFDQTVGISCDGSKQVDFFSFNVDSSSSGIKGVQTPSVVLSCSSSVTVARFALNKKPDKLLSKVLVVGYGKMIVAVWEVRVKTYGSSKAIMPTHIVTAEDFSKELLCARPAESPNLAVVALGGKVPEFCELQPNSSLEGGAQIVRFFEPEAKNKPVESKEVKTLQRAARVIGPLESAGCRQAQKRPAPDGVAQEPKEKLIKLPETDKPDEVCDRIGIAATLKQCIRSKDPKALRELLHDFHLNTNVVKSTIKSLSGAEAFDLLQEITKLMADSTHDTNLTIWIHYVLAYYGVFISSQPQLKLALLPLHDIIQTRVSHYPVVSRLRSHIRYLRCAGDCALEAEKKWSEAMGNPLLEYTEGDENETGESSSEKGVHLEGPEEAASEMDSDMEDLLSDYGE